MPIDVPGLVSASRPPRHRRRHRRVAAAHRDDPVVPRRPRRPVEPRRGGHGPRPRRPPRRGRAGLRVARRPAAGRRLVAPVLPGRRRAHQSSRTSSTPTSAPTSPPACGTTGCCTERPRLRRGASGRSSSGPSTSCSTCRPRAARSSGPATPTARRGRFALLTGSSSICHSLRCAIALAELLGHERPDWELSAARLAHVIANVPDAFAPKHRWAMDWYYPVLARRGARRRRPRAPRRAPRHLRDRGPGRALRVRPPVGHRGRDLRVRPGPPRRRRPPHRRGALRAGPSSSATTDGRYWTGTVFPERGPLPRRRALDLHRGRVVLAADALAGASRRRQRARSSTTTRVLPDAHRPRRDRRAQTRREDPAG